MPNYLSLSSKDMEKILRRRGFRLSRGKGRLGYVKGRKRRVTLLSQQKDFAPDTIKEYDPAVWINKNRMVSCTKKEVKNNPR